MHHHHCSSSIVLFWMLTIRTFTVGLRLLLVSKKWVNYRPGCYNFNSCRAWFTSVSSMDSGQGLYGCVVVVVVVMQVCSVIVHELNLQMGYCHCRYCRCYVSYYYLLLLLLLLPPSPLLLSSTLVFRSAPRIGMAIQKDGGHDAADIGGIV